MELFKSDVHLIEVEAFPTEIRRWPYSKNKFDSLVLTRICASLVEGVPVANRVPNLDADLHLVSSFLLKSREMVEPATIVAAAGGKRWAPPKSESEGLNGANRRRVHVRPGSAWAAGLALDSQISR